MYRHGWTDTYSVPAHANANGHGMHRYVEPDFKQLGTHPQTLWTLKPYKLRDPFTRPLNYGNTAKGSDFPDPFR